MSKRDLAKPGETFWCVVENLYIPEGGSLSEKEYCVCSAEVARLFQEQGDMALHVRGPDGRLILRYHKNADIGKRVFRTPREAALYALELTEKNDRVWAHMMGEKPMRRTWEKYLEEDVNV